MQTTQRSNQINKRGFTLIELLVAMAAATILSLTAFQVYGSYHRLFLHMISDYHQESQELLVRVKKVIPYNRSSFSRQTVAVPGSRF